MGGGPRIHPTLPAELDDDVEKAESRESSWRSDVRRHSANVRWVHEAARKIDLDANKIFWFHRTIITERICDTQDKENTCLSSLKISWPAHA